MNPAEKPSYGLVAWLFMISLVLMAITWAMPHISDSLHPLSSIRHCLEFMETPCFDASIPQKSSMISTPQFQTHPTPSFFLFRIVSASPGYPHYPPPGYPHYPPPGYPYAPPGGAKLGNMEAFWDGCTIYPLVMTNIGKL